MSTLFDPDGLASSLAKVFSHPKPDFAALMQNFENTDTQAEPVEDSELPSHKQATSFHDQDSRYGSEHEEDSEEDDKAATKKDA